MLMVNVELDILFCLISTVTLVGILILLCMLPIKKAKHIINLIDNNRKARIQIVVTLIIAIVLSGFNNIELVSNATRNISDIANFNLSLNLVLRSVLIAVSFTVIVIIVTLMLAKSYEISGYCKEMNRITNEIKSCEEKAYQAKNIKKKYFIRDNIIYLKNNKSQDKL